MGRDALVVSGLARLARFMESRGFHVEEGIERINGFTGLIETRYVTGHKGEVKVRVSTLPSGGYRVTVLAVGSSATRSLADELEDLGGSVEFDEALERLMAVFKRVELGVAESVIRRMP